MLRFPGCFRSPENLATLALGLLAQDDKPVLDHDEGLARTANAGWFNPVARPIGQLSCRGISMCNDELSPGVARLYAVQPTLDITLALACH
jgi:hypothetical protein